MYNTKVMGHRGAAHVAPENTLAAIKAAAELGVQWIEIDVTLAQESALIIFHDDTLDRCTNGKGLVVNSKLAELKQLDAGSWFDPKFSNETIPTLVEALECIQFLDLGLNLEIKYTADQVERIVDPVMADLTRYWQDESKLMISSFNKQALQRVRQHNSTLRLGQLYDEIPADWRATLDAIDAFSLNCDYKHLTPELAREIKQAGYRLFCYTANNPQDVISHWEWGMDTIITDDPAAFMQLGMRE